MGKISVDVNNQRIMTLIQHKHDGAIQVSTDESIHIITPGELVMLINYFHNCKNGMEKSDYIEPGNSSV